MDQITDEERRRIAELVAEAAPPWRLHQEINRSRHAIRRAVVALYRPARREPRRSPLRLSLAEREEISRGRAAGRSVRAIARGIGRCASTVCREVAANGGRERYRACDAGCGGLARGIIAAARASAWWRDVRFGHAGLSPRVARTRVASRAW
jgi:IS30 family transposase